MSKGKLSALFKATKIFVTKHSPEILTGVGVAGMISTTVLAVRATPKALVLLEKEKERQNTDKLEAADTVKTAWKCYVPAAVTGTLSVACIIFAGTVNTKQKAALATAYALSETAFSEYRNKVVETIGEKKERTIKDGIAKDKIEKTPLKNREVIITEKGNTLCLDYISGRYFKSDIDTIKKAVNELNLRMRDEMFISLNDFYYELGLSATGLGDELGWNIDKGYIEPDFSSQLAEDGTPCLVIKHSVSPKYDFSLA